MLTSACSAVLASTGLTVWISIVAVIGGSITSWTEFSGMGRSWAVMLVPSRRSGAFVVVETLTTVEQGAAPV